MALTPCRECGKDVSTQAQSCPHCGAPINQAPQRNMAATPPPKKKKSSGGCGIILAMLLTAPCLYGAVSAFLKTTETVQEVIEESPASAENTEAPPEKFNPIPLIGGVEGAIKDGRLQDTKPLIEKLKANDVDTTELEKKIELRAEELAKEAEAKRVEDIATVVKAKGCDDWETQWGKLSAIKPDEVNADAKKALARLEKCRKKAISEYTKRLAAEDIDRRKSIEDKIDDIFLESGLDVSVKTYGKGLKNIKLSNVLFENRVVIKRYTDAGLLTILKAAGFEKAIFSGYDSYYTYELEPVDMPPEKASQLHWMSKKLDEPLKFAADDAGAK